MLVLLRQCASGSVSLRIPGKFALDRIQRNLAQPFCILHMDPHRCAQSSLSQLVINTMSWQLVSIKVQFFPTGPHIPTHRRCQCHGRAACQCLLPPLRLATRPRDGYAARHGLLPPMWLGAGSLCVAGFYIMLGEASNRSIDTSLLLRLLLHC